MSVFKSYARAIYETAKESLGSSGAELSRSVEKVEQEIGVFLSTVEPSREARIAFFGPVTTAKEKVALTQEFSRKLGLGDLTARSLSLVARKQRIPILGKIREALTELRLASEGGVSGSLISADPLSAEEVRGLADAFGKKLGKKVVFATSIDPTLLAGVRVAVNGVTYDGTLRSQLQRLRDQIAVVEGH